MNWNAIFGITCIVGFFVPVGVVLVNRFYVHRSLVALMIYFGLTGIYNIMSRGFIPVSTSFLNNFNLICNYADAPLMLTSLLFFCPNKQRQNFVKVLIGIFIGYEIVITILEGFNLNALVYILGPGIFLVFGYALYLFVRQVKFSIMHRKSHGKIFMLSSILFAYSCYALIYYFYYIQHTEFKADVMVLYYISSSIASFTMGYGLHILRKRIKELQMLRVTRKELQLFFGH